MFNIIVGTNREGSLSLVAAQDISAIYTDLGIENQLLLLSDLSPIAFGGVVTYSSVILTTGCGDILPI